MKSHRQIVGRFWVVGVENKRISIGRHRLRILRFLKGAVSNIIIGRRFKGLRRAWYLRRLAKGLGRVSIFTQAIKGVSGVENRPWIIGRGFDGGKIVVEGGSVLLVVIKFISCS